MRWEDALMKECLRAKNHGGEVKIIFIKRQEKRFPIIETYIDNQIKCDDEIVIED